MGHKVHPIIHRLPFIQLWDSKWFGRNLQLPGLLRQEVAIREYIEKKFKDAGIDSMSVERTPKDLTVTILAAKPGVIVGRNGAGLDETRKHLERKVLQYKTKVRLNVQALKQPALSAQVIAQNAAAEIVRRIPFRRVMKQVVERVITAGAKGVKIRMSGRLNGVEIARREVLAAGKMSLITLRSNVDYAFVEALTLYGKIGVKVWVYHGETFGRRDKFAQKEEVKK